MKLVRTAALAFALLFILCGASLAADTKLPILMYHHIAEQEQYNNLTVSPDAFRRDMQWLADNGFTALLPTDLIAIKDCRIHMPERPVMITFDDGYESNYTYAFPILRETGMKATIAIVACMANNGEWKTWGCTWDQLREMSESGLVEIGSHTFNLHWEATNTTREGILRQKNELYEQYIARVVSDLERSKSVIEQELSKKCIYFAYPYGQTDGWLNAYIKDNGLFGITTTLAGTMADISGGTLLLPRIRISMNESVSSRAAIKQMTAKKITAQSNNTSIYADGKVYKLYTYLINGTNYVKLRDVAYILNGTESSFEIGWNGAERSISINRGAYTPVGGELMEKLTGTFETQPVNVWTYVNGEKRLLTAYNIGGNNYFNLRSLGRELDFGVDWNEETRTVSLGK